MEDDLSPLQKDELERAEMNEDGVDATDLLSNDQPSVKLTDKSERSTDISLTTLDKLAFDHNFVTQKCINCKEIAANHELDHKTFPLDNNQINALVEQSLNNIDHANKVYREAEVMLREANDLNKDTQEKLDEPLEYIKQEVIDEFKKYAKIGAAGGTPIVLVVIALVSYLAPLIGNLF